MFFCMSCDSRENREQANIIKIIGAFQVNIWHLRGSADRKSLAFAYFKMPIFLPTVREQTELELRFT